MDASQHLPGIAEVLEAVSKDPAVSLELLVQWLLLEHLLDITHKHFLAMSACGFRIARHDFDADPLGAGVPAAVGPCQGAGAAAHLNESIHLRQ
jgi:hypothetical protein